MASVEGWSQTVWDWASKMGLGGLVVWLVQRWFNKRDKAAKIALPRDRHGHRRFAAGGRKTASACQTFAPLSDRQTAREHWCALSGLADL